MLLGTLSEAIGNETSSRPSNSSAGLQSESESYSPASQPIAAGSLRPSNPKAEPSDLFVAAETDFSPPWLCRPPHRPWLKFTKALDLSVAWSFPGLVFPTALYLAGCGFTKACNFPVAWPPLAGGLTPGLDFATVDLPELAAAWPPLGCGSTPGLATHTGIPGGGNSGNSSLLTSLH